MKTLQEVLEFLDEKLNNLDPSDMAPCAGLRLNALRQIYKVTNDEKAKEIILGCADKIVEADSIITQKSEEMEYTSPLIVLFSAYDISGDEKYKQKIVSLEKDVSADGKKKVYTGLVFDMLYETKFGGKEKYYKVTGDAVNMKERHFENELSSVLYLEVLADMIEAIDQPMYELYRKLVDTFRDKVHEALSGAYPYEDAKANLIFAYALKKACRMKVLLAEKYEKIADEIIDKWEKVNCPYCLAFSQTL